MQHHPQLKRFISDHRVIPQAGKRLTAKRLNNDLLIALAVCARYGLTIGAKSAPFVLVLMYVLCEYLPGRTLMALTNDVSLVSLSPHCMADGETSRQSVRRRQS